MNSVYEVVRDHLDKLLALGDAEALALHFQSQGLKAFCKDPHRCMIAESLRTELRGAFPDSDIAIVVGAGALSVDIDREYGVSTQYPGSSLHTFIDRFDQRRYPELISG